MRRIGLLKTTKTAVKPKSTTNQRGGAKNASKQG